MLFAAVVWTWGLVGPWLWWLWAAGAVALNAGLKCCGMAFLFERAGKWWRRA